jgi:hypothetical protein
MGWKGAGNPQPGHTKGGAAGSNSIPLAVARAIFGTKGKTTQKPAKGK